MTTKTFLHQLVDELPDRQTATAQRILEAIKAGTVDPVTVALLLAPQDDEPLIDKDQAALQDACEAETHGEVLTTEELRYRLEPRREPIPGPVGQTSGERS